MLPSSAAVSAPLATGFRPATIAPPAQRLGLLERARALFRNPITIWPQEMYDGRVMIEGALGVTNAHVAEPRLVKSVLLDDADCYHRARLMRIVLTPALGEGMLTADGEHWRRQRRIAAPSFRMQELQAMTPLMSAAGARAGARLAAQAGGVVDVMPEMVRATFEVITDAVLGEDGQDLIDHAAFARDVDVYLNKAGQVDALDVLGVTAWWPRPWKWAAAGATRRIRAAAAAAVAARRAAGADGGALVDRLIRAVDPEEGGGLTDAEVVDNIVTLFGAGHETTAMALTWTLFILAQQPEWQEALRAEALAAAGPAGPDAPSISAEQLDALALHEMVVKEALRLYPPAAVISREAVAPVRLGDVELTAGDQAIVATYVMHRSRALWERPDEFDPNRFAPDAPPIDRYAYLPFGGGPRICIGMGFAMIEARAMLAEILRRVRVAPGPERVVEPVLRVTLRPKGGMPLRLEPISPSGG